MREYQCDQRLFQSTKLCLVSCRYVPKVCFVSIQLSTIDAWTRTASDQVQACDRSNNCQHPRAKCRSPASSIIYIPPASSKQLTYVVRTATRTNDVTGVFHKEDPEQLPYAPIDHLSSHQTTTSYRFAKLQLLLYIYKTLAVTRTQRTYTPVNTSKTNRSVGNKRSS